MKKSNLWTCLAISSFVTLVIPSTWAVENRANQANQIQTTKNRVTISQNQATNPATGVQNPGASSQAAGMSSQNSGSSTQNPESSIQNSGTSIQNSGGNQQSQSMNPQNPATNPQNQNGNPQSLGPNTNTSKTAPLPKTPDEALQRLLEGNRRFVDNRIICPAPNKNEERRAETESKQQPFAIVVGCSDSRVPPEFVFDQGIADIFVIRIAGNVVADLELDSVEYSVLVNNSKIVVVLGHQNCGAVEAVMQNNAKDIPSVAALIKPALKNAKGEKMTLKDAIIANVKNSVARIKASEPISKMIKQDKLKVVGAYYDFRSGEAQLIDETK